MARRARTCGSGRSPAGSAPVRHDDPVPESPSFEQAWSRASSVDGWLTRDQARVLFDEAVRAGSGTLVEIGSHLGRSTSVLAAAAAHVVAIDPFPADWRYGQEGTADRLRRHLAAAGVLDRVTLHETTSAEVFRGWSEPVRLLYVDGKHDALSCLADLRFTRFLSPGDRFLVHDAFSSLGVTLALLGRLPGDRRTRFLGRTGSLALYEVAPPTSADRLRVLAQLPWFVRNLGLKVLLRLRLRRVAALLGHPDAHDPY